MKTVNVITVISAARVDAPRLDDALLQQISQVDPSVKVKDASTLVAGELRGDPAARKNMDALLAETEVLAAALRRELQVPVVIALRYAPPFARAAAAEPDQAGNWHWPASQPWCVKRPR